MYLTSFRCPESDDVCNGRDDESGEAHEERPNQRVERSKEGECKG